MARNHQKYDYAELAFDRDSPLYKALAADAAATGKPIGQIAMMRLADYYNGRFAVSTQPPAALSRVAVHQEPEERTMPSARHPKPIPPLAPPKLPVLGQAVEDDTQNAKDPELNEEQASDNIAAFLANQNDLFT